MKRINRVRKSADFEKLIHSKQSINTPEILVYFLDNCLNHTRVGVVASKKIGNAVKRNKIKRQLRQMAMKESLNVGVDLIFIAKKNYNVENFCENSCAIQKVIDEIRRKTDEK